MKSEIILLLLLTDLWKAWRHPNLIILLWEPTFLIYIYYIIKIIGKKDDLDYYQTIISPKYLTKDNYYKHGRYKQTAGYELIGY